MSNEIKSYHCPNCMADLKYSPDKQKFACDFCLSEFTEEELLKFWNRMGGAADEEVTNTQTAADIPEMDKSPEQRQAEDEFGENAQLYLCPNCGAEIICEETTASTTCYYCHNPVILKGRVDGSYRPSRVIPFKFGRDRAVEIFTKWVKKKKLRPKDMLSVAQLSKLTGLYVPFWVADADTSTHIEATGVKTRSWTSGEYNYREVKRFSVVRDLDVDYYGVPADGSQKIEDSLMEAIEPFDYKESKEFNMAYLSGFMADKYDVDKDAVLPRIKQRMFENTANEAFSGNGYSKIESKKQWDRINRLNWNYMLLPVWFMTYEYKGKILEYVINGQTEKISGEVPLSKSKLSLFLLMLTALITGGLMLLIYLGEFFLS